MGLVAYHKFLAWPPILSHACVVRYAAGQRSVWRIRTWTKFLYFLQTLFSGVRVSESQLDKISKKSGLQKISNKNGECKKGGTQTPLYSVQELGHKICRQNSCLVAESRFSRTTWTFRNSNFTTEIANLWKKQKQNKGLLHQFCSKSEWETPRILVGLISWTGQLQ